MTKKSHANIDTIWTYSGNTVNRYVLKYYAIIHCDAASFFYIYRKISPSKEVFKNQAV